MFALPLGTDAELRMLELRHADELFDLTDQNRFYLRQWLGWVDGTQSVFDSRTFIRGMVQQYANNNGFQAGIWFRGTLAGVIGFNYIDWHNSRTEFGYWLGAPFQGHGLITRACRALINYSFDDLHLNRVEILCASGNTRSRAIPERLGFTQEGIIRQGEWLYDHFVDLVMYGMLADEWHDLAAEANQPQ
jgi:ribosomal-protein-serine acetyltransferase